MRELGMEMYDNIQFLKQTLRKPNRMASISPWKRNRFLQTVGVEERRGEKVKT